MSSEITRELLQTAPVEGMPGWETRLFLITYPAGADGSGHSHPVPGIGYVLEGTMVSAFDGRLEGGLGGCISLAPATLQWC